MRSPFNGIPLPVLVSIALEALVKRVDEDLVKDAFKHVVLRDGVLRSIDIQDVVYHVIEKGYSRELYGAYLELRIRRDDAHRLIQVLFDHGFDIFEEDGLITAYKGENIALKVSLKGEKCLIEILDGRTVEDFVKLEVRIDGRPLVEYFVKGMPIECAHTLDVFYVLNPARMSLDIIADAYVFLLKRGLNRVPSNGDVAECLFSRGIVDADFIRAYTHRGITESLALSLGLELGIGECEVELRKEGHILLKAICTYGQDILRLVYLDAEAMRQLGICVNPIDLGSPNIVEYLDYILFKLK